MPEFYSLEALVGHLSFCWHHFVIMMQQNGFDADYKIILSTKRRCQPLDAVDFFLFNFSCFQGGRSALFHSRLLEIANHEHEVVCCWCRIGIERTVISAKKTLSSWVFAFNCSLATKISGDQGKGNVPWQDNSNTLTHARTQVQVNSLIPEISHVHLKYYLWQTEDLNRLKTFLN